MMGLKFQSVKEDFIINLFRSGCKISGKGVRMHKGMGVRFANFMSFL